MLHKIPGHGPPAYAYREKGTGGSGAKLEVADLSEVWAYIYVPHDLLARLRTGWSKVSCRKRVTGNSPAAYPLFIRSQFTPKNVQTRKERTRLVFAVR